MKSASSGAAPYQGRNADLPEIVFNQATIRERWGLAEFLEGCASRGLSRASLWSDDVTKVGLAGTRKLLAETGVSTFGFNRAGPLVGIDAADRREKEDAARRVIEFAFELGVDHVMVFSGGLPTGSRDLDGERSRNEEAVASLLEHAREAGVKLALEPLHPMLAGDRSVVVSLAHANDICDRLGEGIGIVVDVYHVWWDERLPTEIDRAGRAGRLLGFHVNDWLVPTKHILRDRGMMGDGIIDLSAIWRQVRATGYRGPIEVEIFSERWWAEHPDVVLDTALTRCREIFARVDAE